MSNSVDSKIFIDLDYTLGHLNVKNNTWFLYDNVEESLKILNKKCPLILITANKRTSVDSLFKSFPEFSKNFSSTLTCEDIAPHFLKIIYEFSNRVSSGQIPSDYNFLKFIYELWKENPKNALPENTQNHSSSLSYETWENEVYFPIIAPNKATFC